MAERVVIDSPYAIRVDPEASAFVTANAEKAVKQHCAACHGADLRGKLGVPNLIDYEFMWGITFEEASDVGPVSSLEQTIRYGIRNQDCPAVTALAQYGDCPDTRYSEMPGFLAQGTLTADQIRDLTEYVVKLSGREAERRRGGTRQGGFRRRLHGVPRSRRHRLQTVRRAQPDG